MIFFYILVLSLPFVEHGLFGKEIFGLTLEKYLGLCCILYALFYLRRRRTMPRVFAYGQARFFAIYVFTAMVSYLVTSEELIFKDLIGLFLSQFIFFLAVLILVDSRERLEHALLMATASMGLISLYLLREYAANVPIYGLAYRPGWVAGDPNMYTASALIVLPIMPYLMFHAARRWQRLLVFGCLGLTLLGILLAASRGGFIGLICVLALQLRDARHRGRLIVAAVIILLVAFVSPYSPLDRLMHPTQSDQESSDARLRLWSVSEQIFLDHPVLGVGLWQFPVYMKRYLAPGQELAFVVPHNTYLEAAVELGTVGLAAFLAVIGFSLANLARLRRAARRAGDEFMQAVSTALGSGIVGFCVAAFFLSAKHAKLFWFAVYLSCAVPALLQSKAAEETEAAELEPAAEDSPSPASPPDSEALRAGNWLTRH